MEKADKSLRAALLRLGGPPGIGGLRERPVELLEAVWPLVVGQQLAAHTRPVTWNEGRVEVAVGEKHWREQLEGMTDQLRAQINRWWGSKLVGEVRIVPGKVVRSLAPDQAQSAGRATQPRAQAGAEGNMGPALEEWQAWAATIADKELRELVARVATQYLANQEKARELLGAPLKATGEDETEK